jgi:histidinol-phosphate aminotransferase
MTPVDVASLIRSDVAGMEEYTPIVPFEVLSQRLGFAPHDLVKLDANENPYGPSPRAIEAMCAFPFMYVYPDPDQAVLRVGLERYIGVDRSHILCGNGSDELIDVILRLFIQPGDGILNCPPTFGMYSFLSQIAGARQVEVPRRTDFSLDLEAIEAQFAAGAEPRIKLVFVCQPNNPDGSVTPPADLERLLRLPAVIVVDEAYAEFSGESIVDWVPSCRNLIVLRTFSKWAGLAGLRLGYGLFPHDIIKHLWKIKQPYNINVAAQTAALASVADLEYLRGNVDRIVAERGRLFGLLGEVPYLCPYPSRSNFILCRVRGRDAKAIRCALEQQGILIRYFHKAGLTDCIRISVGTPAQSDRLLEALHKL